MERTESARKSSINKMQKLFICMGENKLFLKLPTFSNKEKSDGLFDHLNQGDKFV
jgi:hypothetical protein